MQAGSRSGALAIIGFAILGIVWIGLELTAVSLGFENPDSPAISLRFLREHAENFQQAGFVLIVMALTLTVGAFVVSDAMTAWAGPLARRTIAAIGLFSAASFFMYGVLRSSASALLFIDGMDREWGEAAYLVVLMMGTHGFVQAAIFTLCAWAIGISVVGFRARALPLALCLLGIIPAVRLAVLLLGLLGAADALPEALSSVAWFAAMISIPGTMIWVLLLGVVLARRAAPQAPSS